MSEERKEGVRAVWMSRRHTTWRRAPTDDEAREWGPFTLEYRHTPPEGAPEPGERRVDNWGRVSTVRYLYLNGKGCWCVVTDVLTHFLTAWLSLPLAPKYRLAPVELTEEQVEAVREWAAWVAGLNGTGRATTVASLLRVEEIEP